MPVGERFSTHLIDAVLERKRKEREEVRKKLLEQTFKALERLAQIYSFEEAYIFGSLVKPGRFLPGVSDIDIAIAGLDDKDFFPTAAFLSSELGTDVDLVQLECHPLAETIKERV
ncbi:nucleotidyltransferase domain-containing protein [Ammonifex thiophilus]|uniref:Nucleotidyltransferase domain-containing protein n=1 Tax=Ammonifex thiophilus TaxID=444093 RepID=A0A3D8P7X3_9THEO|nr:nucleotidyltransferase domain-containing protein [Ammonifex thiophilus]